MRMFKAIIICSVSLISFDCWSQDKEATTIVLVRHAEKGDADGNDPELSAAGKDRAMRLKGMLDNMKFDRFLSTPYKRTRETLAPIAGSGQIEVYNPATPDAFAQELLKINGKKIIIAGHSNTTPLLVNKLCGQFAYPSLDESEYGWIWVLTILNGRVITCNVLKY
ncbi:MAG TPA: phosphoglycerate mutase family protein [Niabella sp.]|nr:phosphoglycerate mutase family protein [Niabella sp.]